MTPTRFDKAILRHIIYTGLYDNSGDILGTQQWSTNEYDLPMVNASITPGEIIPVLAKEVTIVSTTDANAAGNTTGHAALIIGNHDVAGVNTNNTNEPLAPHPNRGTAMDVDMPLLFGTIYNYNTTYDNTASSDLTIAKLKPSDINIGGLFIMGSDANHPELSKPAISIANPQIIINTGAIINEGIIEVGHDR